jgi:hypothetical protein
MGGYNCSARPAAGGFYAGFSEGMSRGLSGKRAYNAVMESCMAEQGWSK